MQLEMLPFWNWNILVIILSFVLFFFPVQELINQAGRKLSEWLYLGGVKSFADGSLGSNSALFYEVRT